MKWKKLTPLAVWLLITLCPIPDGLNANQWAYFAVFAATISGLLADSLPAGAMGFIGVTVAGVMRYVEPDADKSLAWVLSGFSESVVWLVVGAFIFSLGYKKSGLGRRIALFLVKILGQKTLGLGYAVALADLILAPVTASNTARSAGAIFPIVNSIPKLYGSEPGPTARKMGGYLMWTAFASTAVTSSMFLTALAPNMAAVALVSKTIGLKITWMDFFIGFLPIGILLMLLVPLLTYWIYPPEIKSSQEISKWAGRQLKSMGAMSRNEWIMSGLVMLAMFLWITGSNPGISVPGLGSNFIASTMVVFLIVSLMLLSQVISFADILQDKSAWEVFIYFTTLLTLTDGLKRIGFINWAAEFAAHHLSGVNPWLALFILLGVFFWIHYLFSSITAHAATLLPVILGIAKGIPGIPMIPLALLCIYSLGLMGVISPYATGPAPMYFASGYITRNEFWKLGLIFGLIFFFVLLGVGTPWLMGLH